MFKKPLVWIAFALLSAVLGFLAARYFGHAFPLVTLDLRMDRESAFAEARDLAREHGWGPRDFRQAASFGVEADVQSYVEREGGGKEAFGEMIRGELYSPYAWEVRHFRPGETVETRIFFTPAGKPYGFSETLPEDEPGASLEEEAARSLAEEKARSAWGIALGEYELVESAQEVRPGGRRDHTFVYERPELRVTEEGRYRLRLTVAGDRVTELRHLLTVPEAFSRRYEEMRSANNFIAIGASFAMLVLYLAGGCGVGLFLLFRQRWVIWKTAVFWGVLVAFVQFLVGLNQWPLTWMGYDTAVSTTNFLLQSLALQIAAFFGLALFFTLAFMGAESLGRRAFPDHLQFWKLWTKDIASSPQVLGQTSAGYLLVSVFFAYEVVLYFFSQRAFGWWSPSDALFNPDALATYFPWLTAIGISLQAGFMEECLFRAVPLAGAALLGRRFGHQRWWILGALLLQALVFGAGHANYPAQPAYARVVELTIPSIFFGLLYLRFGLLPAIVLHFAYDVVWFALPIFVSGAPNAWVDQSIVVVLALLPLGVVLVQRLRAGAFKDVREEHKNAAWSPPPPRAEKGAAEPLRARAGLSGRVRYALWAAGGLGLVLWFLSEPFTSHTSGVSIGRAQAVTTARQALDARGIELDETWKALSTVRADAGPPHLFVWREGGEEAYHDLLGRFLAPPEWWIRFVRFEGEVAERAEEYHVFLTGDGEVNRVEHRLPEGRPGEDLSEDAARQLAHAALAERYGIDTASLAEVSAVPTKQPARRDWLFTYRAADDIPLAEGEARFAAEIAGDEVTHTYRFLHLPEEWERRERDRSTLLGALRILAGGVLLMMFLAAVLVAVVRWTQRKFAVRYFLLFAALMLFFGAVNFVNRWPMLEMNFSTAQPYWMQAATLGLGLVGIGLIALGVGFSLGLVHGLGTLAPSSALRSHTLVSGLSLGGAAAGLSAIAPRFRPSLAPNWPDLTEAGSFLPLIGAALGPASGFITASALFFLIFIAIDTLSRRWSRHRGLIAALFLTLGVVLGSLGEGESVTAWLFSGIFTGLLLFLAYIFVLREDLTLIPLAIGVTSVLAALREGVLGAYGGALLGNVFGMLLVAVLAVFWFRALRPGEVRESS